MLYRGATKPCLRDGKIYFLDVTGHSGGGWNHLEGLFAWFECGEYLYRVGRCSCAEDGEIREVWENEEENLDKIQLAKDRVEDRGRHGDKIKRNK